MEDFCFSGWYPSLWPLWHHILILVLWGWFMWKLFKHSGNRVGSNSIFSNFFFHPLSFQIQTSINWKFLNNPKRLNRNLFPPSKSTNIHSNVGVYPHTWALNTQTTFSLLLSLMNMTLPLSLRRHWKRAATKSCWASVVNLYLFSKSAECHRSNAPGRTLSATTTILSS